MLIKKSKIFFIFQMMVVISAILASIIFIIFSINYNFVDKEQLLYKHQIKKIKNSKYEILILGDSSGGNAISAEYYSKISSLKAGNLSLTGNLVEANVAVLEKINKENLKKVIIISDLDIWLRDQNDGYNFFLNEYENFDNFYHHYFKNLNLFRVVSISKRIVKKFFFGGETIYIYDDYIKQNKVQTIDEEYYLFSKNINENKFRYLKKIFSICNTNNIECIHANGPIIKRFCENKNFKSYLNEVYRNFDLNQIIYNKHVFCLENDEVGDSIGHVASGKKEEFTQKYFEILK